MSSNDKKSVPVPVRTVNLGIAGRPNEGAFNEEDKEILGGFNVPLGKTGQQLQEPQPPPPSMADKRQLTREQALARAREVKRQKYSKNDPQENQQAGEPLPVPNPGSTKDYDDGSLVETEPPVIAEPVHIPNVNSVPAPSDSPYPISPERKRKILQLLQDISDNEDEAEEPPKKKHKSSTSDLKGSHVRKYIADKTLDFGRFLVATTAVALLSGTVKAFASAQGGSVVGSRASEWVRE